MGLASGEQKPPLKRNGMRPMVGWYDPGQLIRTAGEVVISTFFGRHADGRRLDGLSTDEPMIDLRSGETNETSFGFDFTADTGDGWNSTYAVAYALSQARFKATNEEDALPRGDVLVLGGDLVYPYPTQELYEQRLITPFTTAARVHGVEGKLLVIPGNHDWYDSLVNFRRIFCNGRMVCLRQTRQTRSYFAAMLPKRWVMFGVDLQLDHDLDSVQYDFFCRVADGLGNDERVILVVPEPVWHRRWERDDSSETPAETRKLIEDLRDRLGPKLRVAIAGDLHHYQRHSADDERHLITCGTGGAFLHPTHAMPADPTGRFTHQKSFPSLEDSRCLAWRNLLFLRWNWLFGVGPAIAYLLASWQNGLAIGECFANVCIPEMGRLGLSRWWDALEAGVHSALLSPVGLALYGVILAGFVFFADRRSKSFRNWVGVAHAVTHILFGFVIYWFAAYAAITWGGFVPKSIPQYLLAGAIIFPLSWITGSLIVGIYLLLSLNVFGMHRTEAFSSLRIANWKGFLRGRIAPDGGLRLKFIGLRHVPTRWTTEMVGGVEYVHPLHPEHLAGEVIDTIDIR